MKHIKIIILVSFAFLLTSCNLNDIVVGTPNNIEINELSLKKVKLKIYIPIENNNNFSFKIKDANLDLLVNGKNVGKIDKINKFKIKGKSKDIYPVYFELDPKETLNNIMYLYSELQQKSPKLEVDGYIKVSKIGVNKKIKVKHTQNLSL